MSGEANSKFTTQRTEAAIAALERGCTRRAAAGAAGVGHATFYRWLEDETFRDEVEKAEAKAEAAYTMAVANAVPRNWQAAAWWLERRQFQDYGRRDRVDVRIDLKAEATRLAEELGLDVETVLAEATSILAGDR